MKKSVIIYGIILFATIILFGCEKMFMNPYDENAPSDFWKPGSIDYSVLSSTECRLSWIQEEKHIEGFMIDRKVENNNWVNGYSNVLQDSLSWTDNAYTFSSSIPVKYRVYAYANNSLSEKTEVSIELSLPTLTTDSVSLTGSETASCSCNISDNGKGRVLSRGVCWSTNQNPQISDNHSSDGDGSGSFISSITNILRDSIYFIRAYAINAAGIKYGNQLAFLATQIGDDYQGGKLAYILHSNDPGYNVNESHGIIAAPNDISEWGVQICTEVTGAEGTAIGTGAQNTIDMISGCTLTNNAAQLCANLMINEYSDWFLPSIDELNKLYINKGAIGEFSSDKYWSSSRKYSGMWYVWTQDFSNGSQAPTVGSVRARAIRTF